jgi:hypothetical protein
MIYEKLAFDVAAQAIKVENVGNSANTSTQRVTGGGPAPGQTVKSVAGNLVTTSNGVAQTVNTVTAGKTFYITDIDFSGTVSTALDVQIQVGGLVVFERHVSVTNSCDLGGIDSFPPASAGQLVRIFVSNSAAASSLNFFVGGFEQ